MTYGFNKYPSKLLEALRVYMYSPDWHFCFLTGEYVSLFYYSKNNQ